MQTFSTIPCGDFDVVASLTGEAIYLFADDATNDDIRRYSTMDGGFTWGNVGYVASNGATPRIAMSGNKLVLNYYGPVQSDPTISIIRAAIYNESGAGTISAGTFNDIVPNTGVIRRPFQPVFSQSNIWLFYTEGDASEVIKYMLSTDNGVSFGPEQTVGGSTFYSANKFNGVNYSYFGGGCYLTYISHSILTFTDSSNCS